MDILFFSMQRSSFTEKDFEILGSKYKAKYFPPEHLFSFDLVKDIRNSRLLFFWFSSLNFFVPVLLGKILRKKIVIIAGGYDVANVPELKYGNFCPGIKKLITLIMLKMADRIISISRSNYNELLAGYKKAAAKTIMIYHGFKETDAGDFSDKQNIILTIGLVDRSSFLRKGLDRFLGVSKIMKQVEFHHIGKVDPAFEVPQYPNVKFHGFLSSDEFIALLRKAKIYLQLSRHEGFGCSVADAMQYGCIPVVSDAYALPEVAGDTGVIIRYPDDYTLVKEQILQTLSYYNIDQSKRSADRIREIFSFEERKKKILTEIYQLIGS